MAEVDRSPLSSSGRTPAERSQRFNDTTGAMSWNRRSAMLHPDRCTCQNEPTPHKHYPTAPFACARCSECSAYSPAIPEPIVAASPEGSAGLDAATLKQTLFEAAEEIEAQIANNKPRHAASYQVQADQLSALASALPSLIDASRERDRLKAKIGEQHTLIFDLHERDRVRIAQLEAQLTDARSQLEAEKETRLEDLADQRKEWERANAAEDQVESLRSSREQAIAAIDALHRFTHSWGASVDLVEVLSILRGAE